MTKIGAGLFTLADRVEMESLNLRTERNHVLTSNIANAETPGFRALGFDFEKQLQTFSDPETPLNMKVSDPRHLRTPFSQADGSMRPEVYIRPTESIGEDGNTVDVDKEMSQLAENQILFRTAIETLNRKLGMLRYAVNGGRG